jgi:tetratricopeptide (TPR) repeat protein
MAGRQPARPGASLHRERYMDHTAGVRALAGAIEATQAGMERMGKRRFGEAENLFQKALGQAPDDYTALVLMAKCQLALERYAAADRYADRAARVYPAEAQGHHVSGFAKIKRGQYAEALEAFQDAERVLAGNPNTIFFQGLALEGMQRKEQAAQHYYRYLQQVRQGQFAEHAYKRLTQWGYVRS